MPFDHDEPIEKTKERLQVDRKTGMSQDYLNQFKGWYSRLQIYQLKQANVGSPEELVAALTKALKRDNVLIIPYEEYLEKEGGTKLPTDPKRLAELNTLAELVNSAYESIFTDESLNAQQKIDGFIAVTFPALDQMERVIWEK